MTTVLVSIAGAVTAAVAPTAALASTYSMESEFVSKLNSAREANGLRPYSVSSDLTSIAREHSRTMASKGQLYHNPSLTSEVQNWQAVGENVGDGPTVSDIHTAFMQSPEHRANILDHDFTQVGVGVSVDSSGQVWVTEDFRQPMQSTSYHAPAPAPAPTATHHTTTVTHHYSAPVPVQHAIVPAAPRPAARPVHHAPAATSTAVLRARLSKLRAASAAAQTADPVSQAFDYLTSVTTLSS